MITVIKTKTFPQDFLWGAATSAYQVEGNNYNSDWWEWEQKRGLESSGLACNHYNLFQEDFEQAKGLNHNAHRLSLEWSRLEPQEGNFNTKEINHYLQVFKALKEKGFKVMLTLHHFTLPLWLAKKGGFLHPKSVFYFTRFTELAVKKFSDYVDFWITINEPNVFASHGYLAGDWPPGKKNFWQYKKVINRLAECHKQAYKKIHALLPEAQVGIAKNYIYFDAASSPLDKLACKIAKKFWNNVFYKKTKGCHDFLGINYYFHYKIQAQLAPPFYKMKDAISDTRNNAISDLGWEIYPEGLYHILWELKKFNLPIYITENGLADQKDKHRAQFITKHIEMIQKAIAQNIDVRGYLHWSLIDNFEWARGFSPRFGLIEIDYRTQKRTARPSARVYANIIENAKCKNKSVK